MNDSVTIVEEYSLKELQNISTQQEITEEYLEKEIENIASKCKNDITDLLNEAFSLRNEIEKEGNWSNKFTNINSQLEDIFKEKNNFLSEMLYTDGEIQYKKLKIERDKKKLLETKNSIQDAFVLLKDRQNEKETILKKINDKHKAFKQASKYFKTGLDFYVSLENTDEASITVCYFTQKFDDTYSFTLCKNENENKWTLNCVQPSLEKSQLLALQNRFYNTNNFPALLCTLRSIFLKKSVET